MYKHLITIAVVMLSLDIIYLKTISNHFNELMTNIPNKTEMLTNLKK